MSDLPKRELSLFDSTSLIVGIIIGAGVYENAPAIAQGVRVWWGVPLIWVVGGLLSLFGALGYAELATAYPREGGDYVYLGRAMGPLAGFLFGWVQLVIVRPGDIAAMAFIFGKYARAIHDPWGDPDSATGLIVYAAAAVVVLTAINVLGVRQGKWTQNLLTTVKALGLLAIAGAALFATRPAASPAPVGEFPLAVALILVLFCYGGWNEMAYVAAEVKHPERNIVRALVLGTVAVMVLYLLVNGAFLYVLGYAGMAGSKAVATDAVATVLGGAGGAVISALVCISALGAVNGLIFAGARISYAVGRDHRLFRRLGAWHGRTGTPVPALLLQGAIAVGLIVFLESFVNSVLYTAAAVYGFYLATNLSVFILRHKEPSVARPYRVTGYPLTTLVFCAACAFFVYKAVEYRPWMAAAAAGLFLLGLPVYALSRRLSGPGEQTGPPAAA